MSPPPASMAGVNVRPRLLTPTSRPRWRRILRRVSRRLADDGCGIERGRGVSGAKAWESAVESAVRAQRWREAMVIVADMAEAWRVGDEGAPKPTAKCIEEGMRACAAVGDPRSAELLLSTLPWVEGGMDRWEEAGEDPYVAIVKAYEKCGAWRSTLLAFKTYFLDARRRPTIVALGAAVQAAQRLEKWQLAASLSSAMVASMRSEGMRASASLYGSTLEACARTGQWWSACLLLEDVRRSTVPLNVAFFASAIRACGAASRWEASFLLLLSMQQSLVPFDHIIASDSIEIAWASGKRRTALRLTNYFISRWILKSPLTAVANKHVMLDCHGCSPGLACAEITLLIAGIWERVMRGEEPPSAFDIITGHGRRSSTGEARVRTYVEAWLNETCCTAQVSQSNVGRIEIDATSFARWLQKCETKGELLNMLLLLDTA